MFVDLATLRIRGSWTSPVVCLLVVDCVAKVPYYLVINVLGGFSSEWPP